MAITTIEEVDNFTPAYNPVKFKYDSTNKNESGFKYVFDVYESGTANKIAEYRVLPQPTTGYGEIDLSKLLSTKVSYDFNPTNTTEADPTNCYYKYDLKVGEEYIVTYSWTANLVNDGGNVNITPTVAHTFQVGDQVSVDGGVANPLITGLWTVIAINGTTDFTISALWTSVADATGNGSVTYADNRKTVTRDIVTESSKYVWNGALSFSAFKTYLDGNGGDYLLSVATDSLLTTLPEDGFYSTLTQDLWINFGNNSVTTGYVYFANSGGNVFRKSVTTAKIMTQVAVGCNNFGSLTLVSGSGSLIESTTEWYEFYYVSNVGVQRSKKYRVYIDRRCAIEDYEIVFLDRLGSMGSFAFQLRAYERGQSTKQQYNKHLQGSTVSTEWNYNTYENGLTTYQSNVEKTIELNTDWMTEEMAGYFAELITSPVTFVKIGTDYFGCIVMDSSFEIEKSRNKNLIRKTVTIKLANQDIING
jgi:hypothetical protein